MRPSLIIPALLLVPPLAAQMRPISPAPSVIFASAVTAAPSGPPLASDTAFHQDGRTVGTGLGVIAGSAVVFGLSQVIREGGCETGPGGGNCNTQWRPGFGGYLVGAAIGGVTGYLIGATIHHPPSPQ